ncbi:MAG: ATP-binding protein [Myxococcales bacterium]|nr:ATP-binding protein [Myxococcales bacterium]
MSAYRSGPEKSAHDGDGVVEQVVRQFADPYAFVRELVQNAIDASAETVRIVVEEEPASAVRVEDDGKGMTLEIIRGPLLTLFSSSKEGDKGKIGKYGVGFMSVFALEPSRVLVETWRKEGSYRVVIGHDHEFEVRETTPRSGSGTHVTIVMGPDSPSGAEIRERVAESARRWCKHVARPVTVVSGGSEQRVDAPLSLRAPVVVESRSEDLVVLVGPTFGTERLPAEPGDVSNGDLAGFYAHGLTLLEATDTPPVIPGVRFKVSSVDLSHTISRDDVKRDAAYDRSMKLVGRLVSRDLPRALEAAQRGAAESFARTGRAGARELALTASAVRSLEPERVHVPLLEPFKGKDTATLARVLKTSEAARALLARERSPLTSALAERGLCIVRAEAEVELANDSIVDLLGLSGLPVPTDRFALAARHGAVDTRAHLLEAVRKLLRRLRSEIEVELVDVTAGKMDVVAAPATRIDEEHWLLSGEAGSGPRVVVQAAHPVVQRAASMSDARRAASLLARLIWVETQGLLPARGADTLLEAAMGDPP